MAEKTGGAARRIAPRIILLSVIGIVAVLIWRATHKTEGYTGGNVVTTGTVEATHVRLGFKVAGRLASVPVTEGSVVAAGDVVGQLEREDFLVQVRIARATVETARAKVLEAQANRARAERDFARMRALLGVGAATPQQLDDARAAAEVARAQVEAARAQVHQAESALAQAELQLSYTVLQSPQPGIVTERIHLPGEMVTVGSPIVTVAQIDTVKVHAAVDETRVGAVRPGDPVAVRVYTFDRKTFRGTVTDISPAGEFATRKDWGAQRRDIRTFEVTARVPNPEGLLKDGMTAEVTIEVAPAMRRAARTP